jgi:TDP-D-fucosamine acetyltransferase
LVPAAELEAIRAVEDAGFRLVDQRITLARSLESALEAVPSIRKATAEDVPALQGLAAISHIDTRFFADPRFARERCAELYRRWIAKSCVEGYADVVLTEGAAGDPAGYIACHLDAASSRTGRIGLIAVGEKHQGRGVGRRLIAGALHWFAEAGVVEVDVATQAKNIRAQRLYQGSGFKSQSIALWYHKWFTEPAPQP